MVIERTSTPVATWLGLMLALGLPVALISTGALRAILSSFVPVDSIAYVGLREAFFWGLTALVLLVLTIGERRPLSAIGFKRLGWTSLLWGALGFAVIFMTQPLGRMLAHALGAPAAPASAIARLAALPIWLVALIVLRAGVCEEVLFRGYGVERLTALSGSRVLGAVLPALAFMLAHADAYGASYMLNILPVTTILVALFLWRRDLWSNILAHVLTDGVGLTFVIFGRHH